MTDKITKILINGIDLTDFAATDSFIITYELDLKTGALSLGTTNAIEFKGEAYDWLKDYFFTDFKTGYTKTADVQITVNCCGLRTYEFIIDAEGLTFCPDVSGNGCSMDVVLRTSDENDSCYRDLSQKIFWKDNGFNANINNSNWFAKLNFLQAMDIWNWVLLYLWLVVKSIPLIGLIQILDNLFGNGNNVFNRIEDWIVGAGKFQMAFNVRNAIEYNVNKCNLNFVSPTLQSEPGSKLFWLQAQYDNGIDQRHKTSADKVLQLWENNAPNKTTIDLLNDLKPVFNHEFRLIGNDLVFDTRENILDRFDELFNLNDKLREDGLDTCYKYQDIQAYAYGRFEYKLDNVETDGNKAHELYNDIVEWNTNPINEFQRDELNNSVDFAPVRFQNDTLTTKYDIEEIAFFVDFNRRTGLWGRPHSNEVLLSNGYAFLPKLILLGADGKAERVPEPSIFGIPIYNYNRVMRFDENGLSNNLYNKYHYTQNPRLRESNFLEIDGLEVTLTCDILDKLDNNRLNLYITTPYGKGTFDKVEIDFTKGTVKFDNIKI